MNHQPSYRLPHHVVPRHYTLEFTPDAEAGVFQGRAAVEIEIQEPTRDIVLNAVNLTIHTARLENGSGASRAAEAIQYRREDEMAVLTFSDPIPQGAWTLEMSFDGVLSQDLRGFYRTKVTNPDGTPVVILSTQCEATDARRIFPCWDEPAFKATFAISLIIDRDLVALSNGREIKSEDLPDGKKRVTFAKTIPMSTYLVALVIGPFELTEPEFVGQVPVRIAARAGLGHLTALARTGATGALKFFEDYFGIPYPSDKIDHVAIPDFEAGAMENLGCVTYREEALLVDLERSAPVEQMQIVSTIAHETAHMWFGDLVTMRWWNGIWLNEAFATFMAELATDALHPEWDTWTTFGLSKARALRVDGLASTRSIEYPVGPPVEAWGMFDELTYQKGGAVLRMLEQYLTPAVFREGIRQYLNRHRFGNTETSDLWDALESASSQPVRAMMDSWVFQPGYPLVRVRRSEDGRNLVLSQHPFRYLGEGQGRWHVPVVIGAWTQDRAASPLRLILDEEETTVSLPPGTTAVLVNTGAWGFYRVAYDDPALWHGLLSHWSDLNALERLSVVDDAWAAVQAGQAALSHMVPLWEQMAHEYDPDVWAAVARQFGLLDDLATDGDRPHLHALVRRIAAPLLDQLTWDPEPDEDVRRRRVRATVIRTLGVYGADPDVRQRAQALMSGYWAGTASVPPELLTPLAELVAVAGGAREWDAIYRQFQTAKTPQDEKRYLYALAAFEDPQLMERTLAVYQSSEVKTQDGAIALGQALANRHARARVWQVVEEQWNTLIEKYPKMVDFIVAPVGGVVDDPLASRMRDWLQSHPVPQAERHIRQTLEFQEVNGALAKKVRGQLAGLADQTR
ncbi:MAG: M1 family metallopeptidase [Firmicutes bacterium]|nr:M1 family metallopeptidase [Bacillota bacterium]